MESVVRESHSLWVAERTDHRGLCSPPRQVPRPGVPWSCRYRALRRGSTTGAGPGTLAASRLAHPRAGLPEVPAGSARTLGTRGPRGTVARANEGTYRDVPRAPGNPGKGPPFRHQQTPQAPGRPAPVAAPTGGKGPLPKTSLSAEDPGESWSDPARSSPSQWLDDPDSRSAGDPRRPGPDSRPRSGLPSC